jgi:hypothetical protein
MLSESTGYARVPDKVYRTLSAVDGAAIFRVFVNSETPVKQKQDIG